MNMLNFDQTLCRCLFSVSISLGVVSSGTFASASPIRIMAAGDSITEGYIDENNSGAVDDLDMSGGEDSGDAPFQFGWRRQFVDRLTADSVSFDMVGTKQNGAGFANGNDNDHQGAAGFQANGIASEVAGAIPSQLPDIGIVLAGVNDIILANRDAGGTFARITNIVSQFDNAGSVDDIFLSTLTPIFPFAGSNFESIAGKESVIDDTNDLIRDAFEPGGLYFGRTDIHLIDGFTAFAASAVNLPDGLHPSEAAYDALGDTIADGVLAVIPEPGLAGLLGLTMGALATRRRRHQG